MRSQLNTKMEYVYILIQDCIHNLCSPFTFDLLLQLSITTKYNSNLIYELITDQPIYYTSTNQIKLFHNIHSLTIPRYYQYNNLTNLTHINNIKFYNTSLIHDIIKLTHLTSCTLMGINTHKYFHTNLIKLFDSDDDREWCNISSIVSFTHLTYFDVYMNLNKLLSFVNLKSLKIHGTKNISNLSMFTALDTLIIRRSIFCSPEININHSNLTKIITSGLQECIFQNCVNLKYLEITCCKKLTVDKTRLQTLILHSDKLDGKLYFNFTECFNLRYLQLDFYNVNVGCEFSKLTHLTKLTWLFMKNGYDCKINNVIANNLIYLRSNNSCSFDFTNYTNLRTLITDNLEYTHINKLTKLEYLSLCDETFNTSNLYGQNALRKCFIDGENHLYLTYLEISNIRCCNLRLLTNLKTLIWKGMRSVELNNVWDNVIKHLSKLTCLHLFWNEYACYHAKIMDTSCISNLKLKEFHSNIKINNLNHLNELNSLDVKYLPQYKKTFLKLTKLTNIGKDMCYEGLKCKNMHRLNYETDEEHNCLKKRIRNIILPDMKMIK